MTTQAAVNDGSAADTDDVSALMARYEELLVQAQEASREGQLKLNVGSKRTTQARSHLARAKQAIRAGASCGDMALDLTILQDVYPDRDSDVYRGASWLIERLRSHPGELLVYQRYAPSRSWDIGRIPVVNFPDLVLQDSSPRALEQREDFWGDGIALTTSSRGSVSASAHSVILRPIALELRHSLFRLHDPERRQDLFIGDAAVNGLIESLTVEERFGFWVVTRQLGFPIGDNDAEVMAELQRRREEMIPELISAEATLIRYRRQLAHWQQNLSAFLDQRSRGRAGGIAPTPTGVTIDFGLADPIEAAKLALSRLIAVGKADLLMVDNPTLQRAAATAGS